MTNKCEVERVFPIVQEEVGSGKVNVDRYLYYYPYLLQCLENVQNNKSPINILKKMNVTRVGVYAVNEFMDYLLRDRLINRLDAVRLYDLNENAYVDGYKEKSVFGFDRACEDYTNSVIQKIVICNLYLANRIADDFQEKGVRGEDIITIDMLIFGD